MLYIEKATMFSNLHQTQSSIQDKDKALFCFCFFLFRFSAYEVFLSPTLGSEEEISPRRLHIRACNWPWCIISITKRVSLVWLHVTEGTDSWGSKWHPKGTAPTPAFWRDFLYVSTDSCMVSNHGCAPTNAFTRLPHPPQIQLICLLTGNTTDQCQPSHSL
jgi:hypothetical protein